MGWWAWEGVGAEEGCDSGMIVSGRGPLFKGLLHTLLEVFKEERCRDKDEDYPQLRLNVKEWIAGMVPVPPTVLSVLGMLGVLGVLGVLMDTVLFQFAQPVRHEQWRDVSAAMLPGACGVRAGRARGV